MREWKQYKLGEIASFKTGKLNSNAAEVNGLYPFFTCSPETLRINNYAFDQEAVLLAGNNAEGNFNIKYYAGKFNAYQRTYIISGNEGVDNKFLYYALSICLKHFKSYSQGTATKFLTAVILNNFRIIIPESLFVQHRIASILSSLDDKIAVNKKICENLEAQAQALFKHWFVDFAPFFAEQSGKAERKDGKFVESELGMIPLSIICEQITDGVHNSVKDEPNSSYMLLSCKNIVGGVLSKNNYRSISKNTFDSLRLRTKLAKGDILISSVGTIGEIAIVEEDPLNYEFQRSVAIVKPKEKIGTYFLYNALLASKTRLQHAAHGAVQQCLFLGDLKKFKVNCYDIEKAFLYNETVKPLFEEIAKLHQESDRLSTLRDTLLPKLMSGQIKLSEYE